MGLTKVALLGIDWTCLTKDFPNWQGGHRGSRIRFWAIPAMEECVPCSSGVAVFGVVVGSADRGHRFGSAKHNISTLETAVEAAKSDCSHVKQLLDSEEKRATALEEQRKRL